MRLSVRQGLTWHTNSDALFALRNLLGFPVGGDAALKQGSSLVSTSNPSKGPRFSPGAGRLVCPVTRNVLPGRSQEEGLGLHDVPLKESFR